MLLLLVALQTACWHYVDSQHVFMCHTNVMDSTLAAQHAVQRTHWQAPGDPRPSRPLQAAQAALPMPPLPAS